MKQYINSSYNSVRNFIVKQCGYVVDYLSNDIIELSKNIAIDVRKAVENNYVVDWTNNQSKTYDIERAIFMLINKNYFKQIPLIKQKKYDTAFIKLSKGTFFSNCVTKVSYNEIRIL